MISINGNFIIRMLFYQVYWQYFISYVYICFAFNHRLYCIL